MLKEISKKQLLKNLRNAKIIIGNGFDLYCGLKTKYSDFFNSNQNIVEKLKGWIRRLKMMGIRTNYEEFEYDFLWPHEPICDNCTIWDLFFYLRSLKQNNLVNWCDIEEEIKLSIIGSENSIFKWKTVFSILKDGNIMTGDEGTEIERFCAGYSKNLFKGNSYKDFMEYLLEELKIFEKRFGVYVKEQMTERYNIMANDTIGQLAVYDFSRLSIDSFNYTNFHLRKFQHLKINNINGDCDNPIFGIDSSNINPDNDEYIFTKTFRKMRQSLFREKVYQNDVFENVVIFGHSLNEQDYNYFFPVFSKLDIMSSNFQGKIFIVYNIYDEKIEEQIKQEIILKFNKMIYEYEEYNSSKKAKRLVDILYANDKVIFVDIKDLYD